MNAPRLRVVHSREEVLESALRALTLIIGDDVQFPADVRRKCDAARTTLHALRSPQTVRQMERDMGMTPGGDAAKGSTPPHASLITGGQPDYRQAAVVD